MILLNEIATKLENILNGVDSQITATRPNNYNFRVKTFGDMMDSIADNTLKENVIPVFLNQMSGEFEPIPVIESATYQVPITIYIPANQKENFYAWCNFLATAFVGTILNYGTNSGSCLSNIDAPTFTALDTNNFKQFKEWIASVYSISTGITSYWFSIDFTLHLSTAYGTFQENGFIFGNQIKHTLSYVYNGTTYTENLILTESNRTLNTQIASQQLLTSTDSQITTFVTNSAFGNGITIYLRNNTFWQQFLQLYSAGNTQNLNMTYTKDYYLNGFSEQPTLTATYSCVLTQGSLNEDMGDLISVSFTLAKQAVVA